MAKKHTFVWLVNRNGGMNKRFRRNESIQNCIIDIFAQQHLFCGFHFSRLFSVVFPKKNK